MNEEKIRYLEMIEANVAKMNNCSFQMKGWTITIVTAILALFVSTVSQETGIGKNILLIVAIVPTFISWVLDSYYLKEDRRFRKLYEDVVDDKIEKLFSMSRDKYKGFKYSTLRAMFSKTEWPLYCSIIGLLLILYTC